MADEQLRPLVELSNETIADAIREEQTPAYQARIPAATQAGIKRTLEALGRYPQHWNAFYDSLLNRIGQTYINKRTWKNKFDEFDRAAMTYGDTYQEIAVGLLKAHVYDPAQEYLAMDAFGTEKVPVDSVYHTMNFQNYYKLTINRAQVRQAFLNDGNDGLGGLIASQMEAQATSAEIDKYLATCSLFAEYARQGGYWRIHTADITNGNATTDDIQNLLIELKTIMEEMSIRPSTQYNARHWPTVNSPDDFMLITTPRVKATMGVKALAYMFNIEQGNVPNRVITIKPEDFGMKGVQALVVPKEFFFNYRNLQEVTNQRNAVSMGENYFLHLWYTFSVSPFAQAAMAWTGAASDINVIDPKSADASTPVFETHIARYSGQTSTPTDVARGGVVQLVSTVTNSADSDPNAYTVTGVKYSLGDSPKTLSQWTRITDTGMLYAGIDEPNDTINVTAQATYINPSTPEVEQTVSGELAVPVTGDGVFGVNPQLVVSVTATPTSAVVGTDAPITVTGTLTDSRTFDATNMAVIGTDNAQIATVTEGNILHPVTAGSVNMLVRIMGLTEKIAVTVTAA